MLETPHVVVGAAIAMKVGNPALAIPLALGSHFALDKVPHWNPHTYTETTKYGRPKSQTMTIAIVDIALATITGFGIAALSLPDTTRFLVIVLACFASVLPDVVKYPFFLFSGARKGIMKRYVKFERSLQVDTSLFPGLVTQFITLVAALLWIR